MLGLLKKFLRDQVDQLETVLPDPDSLGMTAAQLRHQIELRQLAGVKYRSAAGINTRLVLFLIFVTVSWKWIGGWEAILWLAFCLMHAMAGHKSVDDFFNSATVSRDLRFWKNRTFQMIAVSALSMGFAGWYFMVPDEPVQQMFLVGLVSAVTFAGVPLYAGSMRSLIVYLAFSLIPPVAKLTIIYQFPIGLTIFWVAIVLWVLIFFGLRLNTFYTQDILRSIEREHLVVELVQQRQKADYAREAAEMAIVSKTKFFAGANHDLRQPLQAMGIFISLLEAQVPPNCKGLVLNLSKACQSVSTLVDQILVISKLDSKSLKVHKEKFSLAQLFSALESEFEPMARAKGLKFKVRADDMMLDTDPQLLERILRNLLGNAVRYTSQGGVFLRAATCANGRALISVTDTGPGIDLEERKNLFQEYFRGKSGRASQEGFGLGLSIVHKISQLLGFHLKVLSKPGRGTTFRIEIPMLGNMDWEAGPATPSMSEIIPLNGKRIVIIEDDRLIRDSMQALLEGWGATVIAYEFYNAQLAADLVTSGPIDLILVDYNLGVGRLTGLQSVLRIRSVLGRRIPAIVSTAVPREVVIAQYEQETEGMDFSEKGTDLTTLPVIIQKPVKPSEINRAISQLLA